VILLRYSIFIYGRHFDEKLLWVEPLCQLLDVEVLLINERQVDGGLEVALGPNLTEFGDGHLAVVGDEPVAVLLDQRVQRHLQRDVSLDPRVVGTLDADGRDVVVGVGPDGCDHLDGFSDVVDVEEWFTHPRVVDLELLGLGWVEGGVLGDNELDLRDDLLGG